MNRLREDVSRVCYEGAHLGLSLGIALPGIILWAFGIPLFALILLLRNRKTIL